MKIIKKISAVLLACTSLVAVMGTTYFAETTTPYKSDELISDSSVISSYNQSSAEQLAVKTIKNYLLAISSDGSDCDINGDDKINSLDLAALKTDFLNITDETTTIETETETETTIPEITTEEMAEMVFSLVNEQRTAAGLSTFTTNTEITDAANKRAEEIVTNFAHTRPDGTSCFTVFDEYSITKTYVAENIAMGFPTSAEVMNAWMNSAGHKANILSSNFEYIGVGVYKSAGVYYWVQLFYAD